METRDDEEEEGEEVFYLQLVAVHGGARLPFPRPTAVLRIMKSDNANGRFGFTGACIPDVSADEEFFSNLCTFSKCDCVLALSSPIVDLSRISTQSGV